MVLHLALSGVEPSSLRTRTTLHISKNPILFLLTFGDLLTVYNLSSPYTFTHNMR